MLREYRLHDTKNWYFELLDAVKAFKKEFMKKPEAVGYNDGIYNQINIIVNQEKENVEDVDGNNPNEDEFIELGSIAVGDDSISIWTCDECPDDRFTLMSDPPDGDDGEPYYTLEGGELDFKWNNVA